MPRTEALDAARATAWEVLREAAWPTGRGTGTPGHEEGRRIIHAARVHATRCTGCADAIRDAVHTIDPTGVMSPSPIPDVWTARAANA